MHKGFKIQQNLKAIKTPFSKKDCRILGLLIVFISFIQCRPWMTTSLLSTVAHGFIIGVSSFIFILYSYKSLSIKNKTYWPLYLYLFWITLCSLIAFTELYNDSYIRVFIQHVSGTLVISSIVFLARPKILMYIMKYWKCLSVPLSLVVLLLLETLPPFGFYISILQIFLLLFSILNKKTKILVFVLFLFTMATSIFAEGNSNRAAFIKYGTAFVFGLLPYFQYFLTKWVLRTFQIICFLSPLLLIHVAISGGLNFFDTIENQDKKNEMVQDTRTLIYSEAIVSAYDNNYIILGRTPARGYDSNFELHRSGVPERSAEVSAVNIFTWYGLIGLILYSILLWHITSVGLYKSNNIYIKIISMFLCFRYVFAWIEDANKLDSTNITLWIMMSMCLLPYFRLMNNKKMEKFIYSKM